MRTELEHLDKDTVIVHTDSETAKAIVAFASYMDRNANCLLVSKEMKVEEIAREADEQSKHRPTVQYRAIGGTDALDALGHTTVNGIIFAHLLEHGPCTVKAIRTVKPYSDKAVQSVIHRLKHMDLVQAEPIGGSYEHQL